MQTTPPPRPRPSPVDLVRLWKEGKRHEADDLASEHGYQIVLERGGVRIRDLRARPGAPTATVPLQSVPADPADAPPEPTLNRAQRRREERLLRRKR